MGAWHPRTVAGGPRQCGGKSARVFPPVTQAAKSEPGAAAGLLEKSQPKGAFEAVYQLLELLTRGGVCRILSHDGMSDAEARWAVLNLSRKVGLEVAVGAKPSARSAPQGLSPSFHPTRLHLGNVSGTPRIGGKCLAPGGCISSLVPSDRRNSAQVYLL